MNITAMELLNEKIKKARMYNPEYCFDNGFLNTDVEESDSYITVISHKTKKKEYYQTADEIIDAYYGIITKYNTFEDDLSLRDSDNKVTIDLDRLRISKTGTVFYIEHAFEILEEYGEVVNKSREDARCLKEWIKFVELGDLPVTEDFITIKTRVDAIEIIEPEPAKNYVLTFDE